MESNTVVPFLIGFIAMVVAVIMVLYITTRKPPLSKPVTASTQNINNSIPSSSKADYNKEIKIIADTNKSATTTKPLSTNNSNSSVNKLKTTPEKVSAKSAKPPTFSQLGIMAKAIGDNVVERSDVIDNMMSSFVDSSMTSKDETSSEIHEKDYQIDTPPPPPPKDARPTVTFDLPNEPTSSESSDAKSSTKRRTISQAIKTKFAKKT